MKNIELKINNRYIYLADIYLSTPEECTLCEISTSGKYYKFHTANEGFFWIGRNMVELLEDLGPLEVPQPNPVLQEEILNPKDPESQCEPPTKEFEYSFIVDIADSHVTYRYLLPSNGRTCIADVAEACAKTIGCGKMSNGFIVT